MPISCKEYFSSYENMIFRETSIHGSSPILTRSPLPIDHTTHLPSVDKAFNIPFQMLKPLSDLSSNMIYCSTKWFFIYFYFIILHHIPSSNKTLHRIKNHRFFDDVSKPREFFGLSIFQPEKIVIFSKNRRLRCLVKKHNFLGKNCQGEFINLVNNGNV